MIFILTNVLTLLRGPLALLFLIDHVVYRAIAVSLAMITDILDGYLARRYQVTSQLGACLDPAMDKCFMLIALGACLSEGQLRSWQVLAALSRDFAVLLFGCSLILRGRWGKFPFRSILSGKVTTALQFVLLFALIFGWQIPLFLFIVFIILGFLALFELFLIERRLARSPD